MNQSFRELEAAELFCPKCRRAVPVRKKMLLVLADGDKYDYVCAVCGELVGGKMDKRPGAFNAIISNLKK